MNINLRGVSTFFFFAIPAVLGLAGIYWLAVTRGVVEVRRGFIMNSRHNEIVGAKVLPRGAVQIVLTNADAHGPVIERADIYGSQLTVWVRNDGEVSRGEVGSAITLVWKIIAPNGVLIGSGYDFVSWGVPLLPGQVAEFKTSIYADSRMERLELSIARN